MHDHENEHEYEHAWPSTITITSTSTSKRGRARERPRETRTWRNRSSTRSMGGSEPPPTRLRATRRLPLLHRVSCCRCSNQREHPRGQADLRDQLQRASTSIPLNVAEASGKTGTADRARFCAIARGSALECAAILDVLLLPRRRASRDRTTAASSSCLASSRCSPRCVAEPLPAESGAKCKRCVDLLRSRYPCTSSLLGVTRRKAV